MCCVHRLSGPLSINACWQENRALMLKEEEEDLQTHARQVRLDGSKSGLPRPVSHSTRVSLEQIGLWEVCCECERSDEVTQTRADAQLVLSCCCRTQATAKCPDQKYVFCKLTAMAPMQVLMLKGHRQGYNNLQTTDNLLLKPENGAIAICLRPLLLEACWCICVYMIVSEELVCTARPAGVAQEIHKPHEVIVDLEAAVWPIISDR